MDMITHQKYVSAFLIAVLFVSLLSFSIPQNHEPLEENNPSSYTRTYGDTEHGAERINMIWTQEENYEFIYGDLCSEEVSIISQESPRCDLVSFESIAIITLSRYFDSFALSYTCSITAFPFRG